MKYVLITGVSTGIGYATVEYLQERGFFVFGSVRKAEEAEKLQKTFGESFKALVFDVTRAEQVAQAVKKVNAILNGQNLTGLVNNAGIAVAGPLENIPMEKIRYQFDVNVFGVMEVSKAFLPLLKATSEDKKPGRIINISSVSGIFTTPFGGLYSASKFALESFSDALRRELFIHDIDVIVLQPGPIQTPIWDKTKSETEEYMDTPYAPILKALKSRLDRSAQSGLPPEAVTKRVYDALTLTRPKTRYLISRNAFFMKYILPLIPDRMMDKMIFRGLRKWLDRQER